MTMESRTGNKEEQWKDPNSSASSSRSSSITSDSSDGHFVIRQFPLPKPLLSASEAQKLRETHQAYSSSVSSYTSSSWSSVKQNNLMDLPGYDPNRIPSSVFSSKPANSADWSIASNESLFSIHDGNFNSLREDQGLFRSGEIPKLEEKVLQITEVNAVPPPPVEKPNQSEKETITEEKPEQEEKSDSEIDDSDDEIKETKIIELESDDEHDVKEEDMIKEAEVFVEIEIEKQKEKEIVEIAKENKPDDSNSSVSHSPSISCRSDTSAASHSSFAFPVLKNEDGVIKTPVMEIRNNISQKRRPEYLLPQSPMHRPESQPRLTQIEPQSQPELQRMSSKKSESQTQSPKASRMKFLSCFHCPKKCGLFK